MLGVKGKTNVQEMLRRVKPYRSSDPSFDGEISRFAGAKAERAGEDPTEGRTTRAHGPASMSRSAVRKPRPSWNRDGCGTTGQRE